MKHVIRNGERAAANAPKLIVFRSDKDCQFYWQLRGGNGEPVSAAEGSPTRAGAVRRAKRAQVLMAYALVEFQEEVSVQASKKKRKTKMAAAPVTSTRRIDHARHNR